MAISSPPLSQGAASLSLPLSLSLHCAAHLLLFCSSLSTARPKKGRKTLRCSSSLADSRHIQSVDSPITQLNEVDINQKTLFLHAVIKSASYTSRSLLEWAPKCPCGYGYMILKTSHTTHDPGRRFWKCPNLHGERGCGLFIWMDEVAPEYTADQNMECEQTESRMKEMKTSR